MTLFAVWLDNGGAHEPLQVMSLWTTREKAVQEIEHLQREAYVYGDHLQPFWLSVVTVDCPYTHPGMPDMETRFPPWEEG